MDDMRGKLALEVSNVEKLKDLLTQSSKQTKSMSSILSHFDERLSRLEETIQPVYKETGNLQEQQDNIVSTLEYLDYVIKFYTVANEVEPIVYTGPIAGRLGSYLECLDRLQEAIQYFERNNPESPELLNVKSLFTKGSDFVEKEFRQLLSRHSDPVPPVLILDLVNEDENTPDSDKMILEQLPEKAKNELRLMSEWLCENKKDDFIVIYASIRAEVLLKSLQGLRDHERSASGVISGAISGVISGAGYSPMPGRKSLPVPRETPTSRKTPKSIQQAFQKLQSVVPGDLLGVVRSQSTIDLKEDPGMSEREIVAYLTSVTALYKLMQSEVKLMEGVIPNALQKAIFSRLVYTSLDSIVREGDELASRVKRSVARNDFNPVLSLFPILRHQAAMRHCFDLILDGCSDQVVFKFQALVVNLQTTISKALNEFVDFIKNDIDPKVPKDGTVHELTSNVMIFLVNLLNFVDILSRVITGGSSTDTAMQRSAKDKNKLVYAQYITRVLAALGLTLKNKADSYSDPFLRAIFMLNNFHYILKTLRKSGLLSILNLYDRDIEVFYEEQILENKKEYSKSWSKILQVILEIDSRSFQSQPSTSNYEMSQQLGGGKMKDKERQMIKDKFHLLNKEFDEVRKAQIGYAIPDSELRDSLKRDNRDFIIPRYTAFYNKYSGMNFAKHMDKYVKYSPSEFSQVMNTFFDSTA